MAELTKTQIKKRVKTLLEELESIKDELTELKDDVENESYSIEPYEGKDELTPAQEERQEWLDNVSSALDTLIDYMDTSELEGYMEE